MPKRIYIPQDASHSGIDVTWTKSAQRIDIGGWYDSCVGLSGGSLTLREFFDSLGITEKDCAKAWKKPNDQAQGEAQASSRLSPGATGSATGDNGGMP